MDKASGTVLDFFTTVEDPRQRGKVLYRLDEILLIVLAGCLAGADNMVEMAGWARLNLESLRSIRPFARGVPSRRLPNRETPSQRASAGPCSSLSSSDWPRSAQT